MATSGNSLNLLSIAVKQKAMYPMRCERRAAEDLAPSLFAGRDLSFATTWELPVIAGFCKSLR